MAKVQLLAVISMDGCLSELQPRERLFRRPEDYGLEEIRGNALYKLTPDYGISILQDWRKKNDDTNCLLEVTSKTMDYANGLLRMNVIDEIIIYIVPVIIGTGKHLFQSALPKANWQLMDYKKYDDDVMRLSYLKRVGL